MPPSDSVGVPLAINIEEFVQGKPGFCGQRAQSVGPATVGQMNYGNVAKGFLTAVRP
jgi:hypothetical protein